jgi:TolB-like protein/Tfp pilus assembly protein PilF
MAEVTSSELQKVEAIFYAVLERGPNEVHAFLDTVCGGDKHLRRQVEALLGSDRHATDFIEKPPTAFAARLIKDEAGETDSLIGRTIGHYKITEKIGSGGMGEVYLAIDTKAERKAVLKLLPARFTSDPARLKRFQQEARAVVALNHPNIVTIYEIGEEDSTSYIVSEFIEGETLRQRLDRQPLELKEAIDVTIQVATALASAHEAGIVHRDIKPENIMLRRDGYAKVLDFGIAKLAEQELLSKIEPGEAIDLVATHVGSILGTVRYMSPEQARGEPVDHRTDIWSLGVVLYEMVTRRSPFSGDTPQDIINATLNSEPLPIARQRTKVFFQLQEIISRALRKDREERYSSMREMLEALRIVNRKLEFSAELGRAPFWLRWVQTPRAAMIVFLLALVAIAVPMFWRQTKPLKIESRPGIAVLPFTNLSKSKDNAFFAEGVQDAILTDLARIADLKVISRSSVAGYGEAAGRNLRKIGQELAVTHLVEGSVRRAGNRVRVNAQLIDTRNGAHLWAQTYDRDLGDVFVIQNEIAAAIAEQLKGKLSPDEKAAITKAPTTDVVANDLFLRAQKLRSSPSDPAAKQNLLEAARLFEEAIARDPQFLLAYCLLADTHLILYWNGFDHTPARRELAKVALENAARLQPNAAEVHLTRGVYYYHGFRDYERARAEFELARKSMPNEPGLYLQLAAISRRQARWDDSLRNFTLATELDPRNFEILVEAGVTCAGLSRYSEARSYLERAHAIIPNDYYARTFLSQLDLFERGDTKPLRNTLTAILNEQRDAAKHVAYAMVNWALAERDHAAAAEALSYIQPEGLVDPDNEVLLPKEWFVGLVARSFGEASQAQSAFATARPVLQRMTIENPEDAPVWSALGMADAALGRAEEAIQEGRKACELLPLDKDAWNGPGRIVDLAIIYTWLGEKDSALQQLEISATHPGGVSYGALKLYPFWDPLRGDARYERLVARIASKKPEAPQ